MALKVALSVLFVGLGTYIGFRLGAKYKRRENYFADIVLLCNRLKCQISFSQNKLSKILLAEKQNSELQKNLTEFIGALERSDSLDEDKLQRLLSKNYLSEEEKRTVAQFLCALGRSDADTQISLIEGFKARFEDSYQKAKELLKKQNGLHTKLGLMGGIMLAILII